MQYVYIYNYTPIYKLSYPCASVNVVFTYSSIWFAFALGFALA